jgi:hypothetical protein
MLNTYNTYAVPKSRILSETDGVHAPAELGHAPVYKVREWSNVQHDDLETLKRFESYDASLRQEWVCHSEPSTCLAKIVSDALVGNTCLRSLSISVTPSQGMGCS